MRCCFIRATFLQANRIRIHSHIDVIEKCIPRVIIPPGHTYAAGFKSMVMRLIRKINNDSVRRRAISSAGALKITSNNDHT